MKDKKVEYFVELGYDAFPDENDLADCEVGTETRYVGSLDDVRHQVKQFIESLGGDVKKN